MNDVAALFVRADSVYKKMPGVDCYDIDRDARQWNGGMPGVFHPPCRAWGRLRHMANPRADEKDLARWAVAQVRQYGGVLEHPKSSTLWADQTLPSPGKMDEFGGWTLPIFQQWWGHRAEKATLLYIVGCTYENLSAIPYDIAEASHVVAASDRKGQAGWRPRCTKAEREHTPEALAIWLVELARRCVRPS